MASADLLPAALYPEKRRASRCAVATSSADISRASGLRVTQFAVLRTLARLGRLSSHRWSGA